MPESPPRISKRSSSIRWSDEKRLTLSAAVALHGTKFSKIAAVFAERYPQDLESRGSLQSLTSAIRVQWHDRRGWNSTPRESQQLQTDYPALIEELRSTTQKSQQSQKSYHSNPPTRSPSSPQFIHGLSTPTRSHIQSRSSPRSKLVTTALGEMSLSKANAHTSLDRLPPSSGSASHATRIYASSGQAPLQAYSSDLPSYEPISSDAAHVSLSDFFYRFYVPNNEAPNCQGFISRFHRLCRSGEWAPLESDSPMIRSHIELHIGNQEVPSPFISVTTDCVWAIRHALKTSARGCTGVRLAVIDARLASGPQGERAFYVPPYHKQLRANRVFPPGKHNYGGKREYLIWAHVEAAAIVSDFAVEDLVRFCNSDVVSSSFFRLSKLGGPGYTAKVLKECSKPSTLDSPQTLEAFARLIVWLCSTSRVPSVPVTTLITNVVSDFVRGYELKPSRQQLSEFEWKTLAQMFGQRMCAQIPKETHHLASPTEISKAFLYGIISGMGDLHWRNEENGARLLQRRARLAGLRSPELIFAAEDTSLTGVLRSIMQPAAGTETQQQIVIRRRRQLAPVLVTPPSDAPATPHTHSPLSSDGTTRADLAETPSRSSSTRVLDAVIIPSSSPSLQSCDFSRYVHREEARTPPADLFDNITVNPETPTPAGTPHAFYSNSGREARPEIIVIDDDDDEAEMHSALEQRLFGEDLDWLQVSNDGDFEYIG